VKKTGKNPSVHAAGFLPLKTSPEKNFLPDRELPAEMRIIAYIKFPGRRQVKKMDKQYDIALIGLAVMGENLARNIAGRGHRIAVYNRTADRTRAFLAGPAAGLRQVVAACQTHGVPVPAFSASLAYYDGYRRAVLPANLIQAERDYFGAHTYERIDRPGTFHTDWMKK
jgi:6-phosphogluconate dehydrogenase